MLDLISHPHCPLLDLPLNLELDIHLVKDLETAIDWLGTILTNSCIQLEAGPQPSITPLILFFLGFWLAFDSTAHFSPHFLQGLLLLQHLSPPVLLPLVETDVAIKDRAKYVDV